MNEVEMLAGQVALLQRQVRALVVTVEHPPRLPEYFVAMAKAIDEVEAVERGLGLAPETAWMPGPRRGEIMRALRARGWSISRVARVFDVSETRVRKCCPAAGGERERKHHGN